MQCGEGQQEVCRTMPPHWPPAMTVYWLEELEVVIALAVLPKLVLELALELGIAVALEPVLALGLAFAFAPAEIPAEQLRKAADSRWELLYARVAFLSAEAKGM